MKAWRVLVLVLLVLVLWGYVVGPMLATVRESISGDNGPLTSYSRFFDFGKSAQGESMLWSLIISLLSVLLAGIAGVFLAVLFNRWDFPLRKTCQVFVLVPIALPPLMGVEAFVLLFGLGGTVPQLLGQLFQRPPATFAIGGIAGVLLVHTQTMYPYFYLSVAAALEQSDDSLEEAAYSLGASRYETWTRVILPMLTPAIVAGSLLTFMSSMASYTAPLLFGVDKVMTSQIVIAKTNGDLRFASVISVMLALISVIFLIGLQIYERRTIYRTQSKGAVRRRSQITNPIAKVISFIVAVAATVFVLLPIAMIFVLAFSVNGSWRTTALPAQYTIGNFARLFQDPRSWDAIRNSLEMSAIAVVGTIVLGVASAYVISRIRFRGKTVIDIAMMLPWALPGTVVAINLITAFANPSIFSFGRVLVGTFAIVPLAYFVRFSPLVFRSTAASLAQLDPSLEEAARSLGGTWLYSFRRVVLPLLYRGIAAGALLAFVNSVGEFVASILIYTPKYRPLSIAINDELYLANYGTAAAFGVLQIVLVLIVLVVTRRMEASSTVRGL